MAPQAPSGFHPPRTAPSKRGSSVWTPGVCKDNPCAGCRICMSCDLPGRQWGAVVFTLCGRLGEKDDRGELVAGCLTLTS